MTVLRHVEHDGISLATQSFGDPGEPALLLIMGATASMLGWPEELCDALAGNGLHVIRFDHRDTGQSTTAPPGETRYAVEDMAADALAILDAYRSEHAHIVGMSLGGYIGQMLAASHPQRVRSLTLIASEPLGWDGEPMPHIAQRFLDHFGTLPALDWTDQMAVTDFLLTTERLCAGTGHGFDEKRERARIAAVLARTDSPASMFNHGALTVREDWTGRFREIACPALVIHGEEDPILPLPNGEALAAGISGASLVVLPETGHQLPLPLIPEIAGHVAKLTAQG